MPKVALLLMLRRIHMAFPSEFEIPYPMLSEDAEYKYILYLCALMERITLNGKTFLVGYHTQEWRASMVLEKPIPCKHSTAWLGVGYYFWTEMEFAHYWGRVKMRTAEAYDIYRAVLDIDNCINAVFDEKGYFFFRKQVEKAITFLMAQNGSQVMLQQVHRFLADNVWPKASVSGILYDDIPQNPKDKSRVYSEIEPLYYKKRIQVVLFDLRDVSHFEIFLEEQS